LLYLHFIGIIKTLENAVIMPIKFLPNYTITPSIVTNLMRIESTKEKISYLPLIPTVLSSLRETARLYTTHYSTMIEGNVLSPDQIQIVLKHEGHFSGCERDEKEVKGYYAALEKVEQSAAAGHLITEKMIQTLHALVTADGRIKIRPTPYRDSQNVIRDGRTKAIVYIPPETKDVSSLMRSMVLWIQEAQNISCPIVAAIAHYQFATIHPYYDGNGRTARLLTTLILHLGGYDLKGLYSLEEYYARNLGAYYEAISIGVSHNYYRGRAKADITKWVEYFIGGMAVSFENVLKRMADVQGLPDQSNLIRKLDPRQRRALELFQEFETVTSRQIGELFGFKPRTSAQICATWVENGFLEMVDSSNRGRKYKLSKQYEGLK
jgi:Fic family protein